MKTCDVLHSSKRQIKSCTPGRSLSHPLNEIRNQSIKIHEEQQHNSNHSYKVDCDSVRKAYFEPRSVPISAKHVTFVHADGVAAHQATGWTSAATNWSLHNIHGQHMDGETLPGRGLTYGSVFLLQMFRGIPSSRCFVGRLSYSDGLWGYLL